MLTIKASRRNKSDHIKTLIIECETVERTIEPGGKQSFWVVGGRWDSAALFIGKPDQVSEAGAPHNHHWFGEIIIENSYGKTTEIARSPGW